jgi:polysaccharide export outer membrane protein
MYKIFLVLVLLFTLNAKADNGYVDYVVGAGDVISINVYRSPDLKTDVRVAADGKIAFPLVGQVNVAGKTTMEIEKIISTQLITKKLLVSPQVNVLVTEFQSKTFAILGNISSPGKYPIKKPLKLTDAIAIAGGYTQTASDTVTIVSEVDGKTLKKSYDVRQLLNDFSDEANPLIKNKDVIQVPKHPVFYIHGQVNKPGEYKLEPNMRVSQALAKGGGVTLRGTTRSMTIERTKLNGKLEKISGKLDVRLQPNDVVYVKESLF